MNDSRAKYVPPSVDAVAFNCPHCGALAKQFWHSVHVNEFSKDRKPNIWSIKDAEEFTGEHIEDLDLRKKAKKSVQRLASARPFFEKSSAYKDSDVHNLHIARCFNCDDISLWLYDKLIWPLTGEAPLPNTDLPSEILSDYEEAGSILNLSPRGAAALLRLCIQKLCKHLGEKGKNIDDDIASLVKRGLDVRVQQALDIVRVVGNNAVHPGAIDLKDDRATAEKLFGLVNLISEIMISQPKHISAMFDGLPANAKDAIKKRDQS